MKDLKRGITVGMPAFNARKTIERSINSILSQDVEVPYEIIIVDDGSTDNTANIGLSYELMHPGVVRLIRTSNKGVAAARNTIVDQAAYDHLTWLDADDFYISNKLSAQYDALMIAHMRYHTIPGDPYVMAFSPFWLDKKPYSFGRYWDEAVKHILTGEFRAYLWASMTATAAYKEVGPFNEELHRSEDTDWLLRYLLSENRLLLETGDELLIQYHFSTSRDGRKVEDSFKFMLFTYGEKMREFDIFDEYVPRRYWEISNFYHSNKKWEDMWRCRSLAAKYGPNPYKTVLDREISGIKEEGYRNHIRKIVNQHLNSSC